MGLYAYKYSRWLVGGRRDLEDSPFGWPLIDPWEHLPNQIGQSCVLCEASWRACRCRKRKEFSRKASSRYDIIDKDEFNEQNSITYMASTTMASRQLIVVVVWRKGRKDWSCKYAHVCSQTFQETNVANNQDVCFIFYIRCWWTFLTNTKQIVGLWTPKFAFPY